jgi:hypothetical protein
MVNSPADLPSYVKYGLFGVGSIIVIVILILWIPLIGFHTNPPNGPMVSWDIVYDDSDDVIVIRHRCGEVIRKETTDFLRIEVRANQTTTRNFTWNGHGGTRSGFPIARGDSIIIQNVSHGEEIWLYWKGGGERDIRRTALLRYTANNSKDRFSSSRCDFNT